MLIAR